MDHSARQAYVEGQILTATPQKLRLMLIDGALRYARKTRNLIEQGDQEAAFESLVRCREIISELLGGIKVETDELTRQVAALYVYLFQTLNKVNLVPGESYLEDVIEVLEIERETWVSVCEKMPTAPATPSGGPEEPAEITADSHPLPLPPTPHLDSTAAGFSLDA